MKIPCLIGCVLLIVSCSAPNRSVRSAQEEAVGEVDLDQMCAQVQCAHNVRIKLKLPDGTMYDQLFDALPVVQPHGVSIHAGQQVIFEADLVGDELTNFQLVHEFKNPGRTIFAQLTQSDNGAMILEMRNPFDRPLRVSMGIMPITDGSLHKTSSCPVVSKGGSFEMWPDPIFQVWIANLRLLNESEDMSCKL